ncbi:hypothetical protein [Sulfurimonas xiamenensis]|uniref:Uncharacterized protein n=1 Tax=Sulfurimonas xiamenensis TaxID=2590021 RepID=A0AAJ4A2W5_9BACT|nr:hypothetical protein [Sulfurimonas xiamenensis]QFR42874.1 hypothetical protein FJR47_02695 [Sulfurimonas xiamenensis]
MKKLILLLSLISLIHAAEQNTEASFDINKDWIYNGCRDVLANKWTDNRNYILGLAVSQKDATLDMLTLMSMRVVNGVDMNKVCKWYFNMTENSEFSSKYLQSAEDSRRTFQDIVSRSVIQDNGEEYETFSANLEKIRKLFKK